MATLCPDSGRCGATYPGWLDGDLPTVKDEEKSMTVYFRTSNCKGVSKFIRVKNCSFYTIYHLVPTQNCLYRYCGTD